MSKTCQFNDVINKECVYMKDGLCEGDMEINAGNSDSWCRNIIEKALNDEMKKSHADSDRRAKIYELYERIKDSTAELEKLAISASEHPEPEISLNEKHDIDAFIFEIEGIINRWSKEMGAFYIE